MLLIWSKNTRAGNGAADSDPHIATLHDMLIVCGCRFETCQQQQINLSKKFGYYSIISKAALEDLQGRTNMWCRLPIEEDDNIINVKIRSFHESLPMSGALLSTWMVVEKGILIISLIYISNFRNFCQTPSYYSNWLHMWQTEHEDLVGDETKVFAQRRLTPCPSSAPSSCLVGAPPWNKCLQDVCNVCDDNKLERSNYKEKWSMSTRERCVCLPEKLSTLLVIQFVWYKEKC